ncbi:MAG: hypothetical protein JWO05_2182 [Gemmatimonadetes bacterium]|nr:hypothetical protein [Gemmatimonadota bacterium]
MRKSALLLVLLVVSVSSTAAAQMPGVPRRPKLAAAADTNDWEAYFDYAVSQLHRERELADAAMYWSNHIDPSRAEPFFGRWVSFWLRDIPRFTRVLSGEEGNPNAADILRVDSLRIAALSRNPFVHQGLRAEVYDELPGSFRGDIATSAWLAYSRAEFPLAIELANRAIKANPARNLYLRYMLAGAYVGSEKYDDATAQLTTLITELRKGDTKQVGFYEAKDLLEYAVGRLLSQKNDIAGATAAFQRSVAENIAFAPAHSALGLIALSKRDLTTATTELALAVELSPDDALYHMQYGDVLMKARRYDDAMRQYSEAISDEPYYADPYFRLGTAFEAAGQKVSAIQAFQGFIAHAPKASLWIYQARDKIAALSK